MIHPLYELDLGEPDDGGPGIGSGCFVKKSLKDRGLSEHFKKINPIFNHLGDEYDFTYLYLGFSHSLK